MTLYYIILILSVGTNCFLIPSNKIESIILQKITSSCEPNSIGTTQNLREIIIGRCHYFKQQLQKHNCDLVELDYNCTEIWHAFDVSVRNETCSIANYNSFLNLTALKIPQNQTVFWSGTSMVTHEYTKKNNFWSLEDTLAGFLTDNLVFCSFNSTQYVYNRSCSNDCSFRNYWNAASIDFAKRASGSAFAVLNGSRAIGAVSNTSTFFRYEVPNLSNKLTKLTVLLLQSPGSQIYETCLRGKSLSMLKNELNKKNIQFECIDNPTEILFYLCFLDPMSKECKSVIFTINSSTNIYKTRQNIPFLVLIVFFLFAL